MSPPQFCGHQQLSGLFPSPPLSAQFSPQGAGRLLRDPLAFETLLLLLTSFLPTNFMPPATLHRPPIPAHNPPPHTGLLQGLFPLPGNTPTPAPNRG